MKLNPACPVSAAQSIRSYKPHTNNVANFLRAIAKLLDIHVINWDFYDAISGALITDNIGIFIVINSNHPKTRQNFSLAHELGHYILNHHKKNNKIFCTTFFNDIQIEKDANIFAAELLMPGEEIDRLVKTHSTTYLAKKYEVSRTAMNRRIENIVNFQSQLSL